MNTDDKNKTRRSYRWTQSAREAVRANLDATGAKRRDLITRLVRETGNPRDACLRFARKLGLRNKRSYRRWNVREHRDLLTLIETNPVRTVALKFHRGPGAIYGMLRRLGATATMRRDSVTLYGLAQLLHVRPQRVREWIAAGLLQFHQEGTPNLPRLIIQFDDFAKFAKQHRELLLNSRINSDRLDFIFKFVFPPSHAELLAVREAKKERAAYDGQTTKSVDDDEFETEAAEDDDYPAAV